MTNNEIFARIAYDVAETGNGNIAIWMTQDLFNRLFPEQFILQKDWAMVTLFGCRIRVVVGSGMWWIVGYEGAAEDE